MYFCTIILIKTSKNYKQYEKNFTTFCVMLTGSHVSISSND